jgi:hypothetical protein
MFKNVYEYFINFLFDLNERQKYLKPPFTDASNIINFVDVSPNINIQKRIRVLNYFF